MGKSTGPLISVIIPTYNDEAYIRGTLISIGSFLSNVSFEIIIVDDGSTDGTIAKIYSLIDHYNINLHIKNHEGVSVARNYGIRYANGHYLMFCDGDDRLVGHLPVFDDADIISFSQNCKESRIIIDNKGKEQLIASMFGFGKEKKNFPAYYGGTVSKLFSYPMIKKYHLHFDRNLTNSEDILFNIQAILVANIIKVYKDGIYVYCYHDHSVTHSYDPRLLNNHLSLITAIKNQFSKLPNSNKLLQRIISLYLYQLVFRQFVFIHNYGIRYKVWQKAMKQTKWNTDLNRWIERLTIRIINYGGIKLAVMMARCYLLIKKIFKRGIQVNETL